MLTDADRARVLDALAAVDRAHAAEARAMETIRATLTGPPSEMRLPGGDVAYQTIRAGEVVPGMWVCHPDTDVWGDGDVRCPCRWHQVTVIGGAATSAGPMVRVEFDDDFFWCGHNFKVRVASTVDGARMAAERQAQQAEAYDHACEAR